MSIKYWWSDDLQWFCILVDDGNGKATVSLPREQAKDLSMESDPEFADMLGKGREYALKALEEARAAALSRQHDDGAT